MQGFSQSKSGSGTSISAAAVTYFPELTECFQAALLMQFDVTQLRSANTVPIHSEHTDAVRLCAGQASTSPLMAKMRAAFASLAATVLLAGCAIGVQVGDPTLLDFLNDGQTTRTEVILNLGQPSATFENERIQTYRIGGDGESGYFVRGASGTWYETNFSLVLVYDADGTLQSHSLVKIR
jgi:hypothetical protein